MPRVAANTRGTGLSIRNSENEIGAAAKGNGKATRGDITQKTADEPVISLGYPKTRRRAALGEITNVSEISMVHYAKYS